MGKDPIEPNEKIIKRMEKHNIDPVQARTYIINNRHNQVTAFYYLLKIKGERDPAFFQEEIPSSIKQLPENSKIASEKTEGRERRDESPVIFRPEQKK